MSWIAMPPSCSKRKQFQFLRLILSEEGRGTVKVERTSKRSGGRSKKAEQLGEKSDGVGMSTNTLKTKDEVP